MKKCRKIRILFEENFGIPVKGTRHSFDPDQPLDYFLHNSSSFLIWKRGFFILFSNYFIVVFKIRMILT